jgi:hypothetical protein
MHTTNYFETFIEASADCPVRQAEIPELKNGGKTVAFLQYEMIKDHPYTYTSDDVLFSGHALRNHIAEAILLPERDLFFSKSQPCLRSSPLVKRYGWGIHSNEDGKVALYAIESSEYRAFCKDQTLRHEQGMRSSRK